MSMVRLSRKSIGMLVPVGRGCCPLAETRTKRERCVSVPDVFHPGPETRGAFVAVLLVFPTWTDWERRFVDDLDERRSRMLFIRGVTSREWGKELLHSVPSKQRYLGTVC